MNAYCLRRPESTIPATPAINQPHPLPRFAWVHRPLARPSWFAISTLLLVTWCGHGATVQFDSLHSAPLAVSESAGMALVPLIRTGDGAGGLTVGYEVIPGSATEGLDFTGGTGVVEFGVGQLRQVISVPILRDALREEPENFTVRLTHVTGTETLGEPAELEIQIEDDDPGPHFGQHFYRLWERTGQLTVHVFRGDDGESPRTLHYRTEDVTARAGIDYEAAAGELTFAPGERFLPVTLQLAADDEDIEPIKTFRLRLSEPGNPATTLAVATVQIDDDDTSVISVVENHSPPSPTNVLRIPVWREHGLNRPASVAFETVELQHEYNPARPGIDYTPVSGRLEFAAGEAEGHVEIPVLDPARDGWDSRSLNLRLADPSPGAEINRREVRVTIRFGPPETPPQGLPPDRVYGYPERLSEAMTPDGKFLAVGTREGTFLWHLPTGRFLRQLATGHTTMLALSPDGSLLATSNGRAHRRRHPFAGLSRDGSLLATSNGSGIQLWEVGQERLRQRLEVTPLSFSFSPDGSQLAVTTWEQRLELFATNHAASRRALPDREIGDGGLYAWQASPTGRWALTSDNQRVTLWDTRTGGAVLALPVGALPPTAEVTPAFSPDESRLLITGGGRAVLWDLAANVRLAEFPGVTHGALSTAAQRLALARPGAIEVRTLAGAVLWQTNYPADWWQLNRLAFSPDGRFLAAGLVDYSGLRATTPQVLLCDVEKGTSITRLEEWVLRFGFSPDSAMFFANSLVGPPSLAGTGIPPQLYAYDTVTLKQRWSHDFAGSGVAAIAFSPDSQFVLLPASPEAEVRRLDSGELVGGWPVVATHGLPEAGWSGDSIVEVHQGHFRQRQTTPPYELITERTTAPGLGGSQRADNSYLSPSNEYWWHLMYSGQSVVLAGTSLDVSERFTQATRPAALGGNTYAVLEANASHVTLFRRGTQERLRSFDLKGQAWRVALSPDDQLLYVNQYYNPSPETQTGLVRALAAEDGREFWRREISGVSGNLPLFPTTQPGRFVVTSSGSGVIHLQEITQPEPVASVGGHGGIVGLDVFPNRRHALAYVRSAMRLAKPGALLGDAAYHLALWNLAAGHVERLIEGADPHLASDGRRLLVRDRVFQTTWWVEDPLTGFRFHTWERTLENSYWQLILSPDGQYVAARGVANDEWMLWLWQAETGELVWRKPYDQTFVGRIAFAPDSKQLLVDLGSGQLELLPVSGLAGVSIAGNGSVQFSPDGSKLLIRGELPSLYSTKNGALLFLLDQLPRWSANNGVFSADSQTLYLSVSQGDWRVPDNMLAVDTTSGQVKSEFPLVASHPRMATFVGEQALLIPGYGGMMVVDATGRPLQQLISGTLHSLKAIVNPSAVVLTAGAGRFGIWDLSHVFNHRLRTVAAPGGPQLHWREGTLQRAPEIIGPWTDLPAAQPPWVIPQQGERSFFRVRGQ